MTDWELQNEDLETFKGLDQPTRQLILRLLDEPTEPDFAALQDHPNGALLAAWLIEQPAYRGVEVDDDE